MTAKRAAKKTPPGTSSVRLRCSVDGCLLTIHARALCEAHYQDLARGRRFAPVQPAEDAEDDSLQVEAEPPAGWCQVAGCKRERVPGGLWCRSHAGAVERLESSLPADVIAATPAGGAMPSYGPGVFLPDTADRGLAGYGLRPVEIEGP